MSMNDYEIFRNMPQTGTADIYNELEVEQPTGDSCSSPDVKSVVMIRQTAAPVGYKFSSDWSTFCYASKGWIADGARLSKNLISTHPDNALKLAEMPAATLAEGVTVQYSDVFNLTFGGLLGVSDVTKIVVEPDPVVVADTNTPKLSETGTDASFAIASALLSMIAAGLFYTSTRYSHFMKRR